MEMQIFTSSPVKRLGMRGDNEVDDDKIDCEPTGLQTDIKTLSTHSSKQWKQEKEIHNVGEWRHHAQVHPLPVKVTPLLSSPLHRVGLDSNGSSNSSYRKYPIETVVLTSNLPRRLDMRNIEERNSQFESIILKSSSPGLTEKRESLQIKRKNLDNFPLQTCSVKSGYTGITKFHEREGIQILNPSSPFKTVLLTSSPAQRRMFRMVKPFSTEIPLATVRHSADRPFETLGMTLKDSSLRITPECQPDRLFVRHVTGRPGSTWRNPNNIDMVYIQSIANQQFDDWRILFDQLDRYKTGEIPIGDFRRLLRDPRFCPDMDRHTLEILEMRCTCNEAGKRTITYQEFINIMSNKRNPSFRLAIEGQGKEDFLSGDTHPNSIFGKMVKRVAKSFLTDDIDRQYYADRYTCCPPPLFVPVITLIEIGFFIYHCLDVGDISPNGPVPTKSFLIYRPDKRLEMWRFIFYMFIHAGWVHLFFNMIIQIVVGIPLEMVHGSCRILLVYMAGVLAGSLGTSVFDINAYLVGASGGVYALLAAHLANILLNYSNMELGVLKLGAVLVIASADVGFAVWDRYSSEDKTPPVSYTAHLMGALAGLTIGLVVLKNFEQKLHEQYLWWIALAVYLGCTVFAVFWNVFYY